jgi:hypothetical protein
MKLEDPHAQGKTRCLKKAAQGPLYRSKSVARAGLVTKPQTRGRLRTCRKIEHAANLTSDLAALDTNNAPADETPRAEVEVL